LSLDRCAASGDSGFAGPVITRSGSRGLDSAEGRTHCCEGQYRSSTGCGIEPEPLSQPAREAISVSRNGPFGTRHGSRTTDGQHNSHSLHTPGAGDSREKPLDTSLGVRGLDVWLSHAWGRTGASLSSAKTSRASNGIAPGFCSPERIVRQQGTQHDGVSRFEQGRANVEDADERNVLEDKDVVLAMRVPWSSRPRRPIQRSNGEREGETDKTERKRGSAATTSGPEDTEDGGGWGAQNAGGRSRETEERLAVDRRSRVRGSPALTQRARQCAVTVLRVAKPAVADRQDASIEGPRARKEEES